MLEKTIWPNGKKYAAVISINLDAEYFGRMYYPNINIEEGDILNLGITSIKYGLPKVLDVLDRYGVKASFFVPGGVAKKYPEAVHQAYARGHEIACRGNEFEIMAQFSKEEQFKMLNNARKEIFDVIGENPTGFRIPEGEINNDTLSVVKELGFKYSSSLSDDDLPYVHKNQNLVELPIHWELYDLPYFTFTFDPPIPPGQARSSKMEDVLDNWIIEISGARKYGTFFHLQIDPQAVGEQGRIFMLEKILDELTTDKDVWLTTDIEIANYYMERRNNHV